MDAVEYVKEMRRICKSHPACNVCPLNSKFCYISTNMCEDAEKAIKIVEEWAKDHPVKTRQSEFLKKFPKADLTRLLPCVIEKDKRAMRCAKYSCFSNPNYCGMCRDDYWNEEVTDND